LVILLAPFVLGSNAPAHSEVVHGFAGMNPAYDENLGGLINDEAFDFSTQTVAPVNDGDLAWEMDMRGLVRLHFRDCYGTIVQTPLEDLDLAPPLPNRIGSGLGNGTYVIRTSDGLYAKLTINVPVGVLFLTIEYYVQTDGSPSFKPLLPVRATTWGGVKALYR
jgi:hypothetical protein